jgi:hypothetical protein
MHVKTENLHACKHACKCACFYMHACKHACNVHVFTCMYTYIHVYNVNMYVCKLYIHTCLHTNMHVNIYVYMHVNVHVTKHACYMHVFTCMSDLTGYAHDIFNTKRKFLIPGMFIFPFSTASEITVAFPF